MSKRIVITGAASGIGAATAEGLRKRGARVVGLDLNASDEGIVARTPIHDAAAEKGLALEGLVPAEPLESAAATLVRAALGEPRRDLATSREGTIGYALMRLLPRKLIDRAVERRLQRAARNGSFAGEAGIGADLRTRLLQR